MSYLGVDIGTSGCKAVLFNRQGSVLGAAFREYAVESPEPGWAELDSQKVGDACLEIIRETAAQAGADPVEAMAISSQGEAFTLLDAGGNVLANAMVSSDLRAAGLLETWVESFGAARLYEITGHTAHPMFSLFKLAWLRENRPDLWKRAEKFLCFEDYLQHRLGLDPAIGWPLAGRTMLFDVRKQRWAPEILESVGVRPGQLARPLASGSVAGVIPPRFARPLGLPEGVRVVAGGHDQVCSALGAGAVGEGQAALTLGTVECLAVAFGQPILSPVLSAANLCTYAHAAPGLYATLAYHLTGGNLLRWYREEWAAADPLPAPETGRNLYDLLLAEMPSTPSDLLVLPYFTASGTPHFDAATPGAILGLRLNTKRGEVLRALLEGLAFELRVNLAVMEQAGISLREIYAVGGGARSLSWLQLQADVLGRRVLRPEINEAGCRGAALLACAAATGESPARLLSEWGGAHKVIEPGAERAAFYARRFPAYQEAYRTLRDFTERNPLSASSRGS